MHLRKNQSTHYLTAFLVLGLASAAAQTQDNSQNSLLSGTYRFRDVAVQNVDSNYNPTEITASSGTITFDGAGSYTIVGSELDNTMNNGAAQTLTITGHYAIGSNGAGYIENPIYPGDPTDYIYGAVSQGVFTGSSTESGLSGNIFNDIFIAIPSGTPTNTSFNSSYQVGLLDFPGASSTSAKNAIFKLAADGAGHLANLTLSGQAADQNGTLTQQIAGATYTFAGDGTGTLTIPLPTGVAANNALITGTRTLFQSSDGNFVLGWTPNGYDIMFGVKTLASSATSTTSQGLYFTTALEDWVSMYGVDSYYGGTNDAGDALGHSIVHQRLSLPGALSFDEGLDDEIVLNGDGTVGSANNGFTDLNGYQVEFGVGGQAFVAIGTQGYFSLLTGIHAASFSGPGVYLNPIGVVNAGSLQPVTASVAPGELLVLYGSGLSSSTVVTQGGQAFPTSLNNVTVTMNGVNCAIYYVSSTAISVAVPWELASNQTGLVNIQVNNNGTMSNVVQVYQTDAAPGSFSTGADGIGYAAATHASNGSVITPSNPVQPGETISLYLTGLGTVTPTVADGAVGPSTTLSYADVYNAGNLAVYFNDYGSNSVGNQGTIGYAGLAPTLSGLYQINVTVPSTGLTAGDNVYVEIQTDAADINQVQIPFGSGAVAPNVVPAVATHAKLRASAIKARRGRASHRALSE
ncbi:MAG TPA: IPT/TIG domain-containing protein [Bryobacteraceae bacterium]|nr:IPT/TIG domain-containing protein [Bryobacteraceae bacterium]